jgi:RNA polymerase sigma-70 factor (ECF subfamily)
VTDDPAASVPAGAATLAPAGAAPLAPADPTDEQLIRLVSRRDPDALAALYDRHRAVAYGIALRVTASVPLAEDVLQEAFLGVWRNAERFDTERGTGRAWLLAIVHHRAVDAVRRRRAVTPLPESADNPPSALVGPDVWPEVAGRLDAVEVRRALAGLPEAQREAIELAYWGGLTQAEIAERTGQPLGTVKGRMRLGLRALGRSLAGGVGPDERRPDDDRIVAGAGTTSRAADSARSEARAGWRDTVWGRLTASLAAALGAVLSARRHRRGTRSAQEAVG